MRKCLRSMLPISDIKRILNDSHAGQKDHKSPLMFYVHPPTGVAGMNTIYYKEGKCTYAERSTDAYNQYKYLESINSF